MVRRAKYVSFRLSYKEYQKMREKAASLHLNFSEFIRRRALEKKVVPESDIQKLEELRSLGRLLKQAFLETKGNHSQDMVNAIHAIESYARGQVENRNGTRKRIDRT